jgi:putative FmdB family regulatory protein
MPLYEYRCKDGHETQVFRQRKWVRCPSCGKRANRVYSAPAISFKGTGFYNTDYRQKKHHGAKEDHSTPQETKDKADAGQSSTLNKST